MSDEELYAVRLTRLLGQDDDEDTETESATDPTSVSDDVVTVESDDDDETTELEAEADEPIHDQLLRQYLLFRCVELQTGHDESVSRAAMFELKKFIDKTLAGVALAARYFHCESPSQNLISLSQPVAVEESEKSDD